MGSSRAEKSRSHARIVEAAAAQIRRGGAASINIATLMRDAGLTHGGFYRHFDSRDALIAEAVATALEHSEHNLRDTSLRQYGSLDEVIDAYLSAEHRDNPGSGCAVALLASDAARVDESARAAYTTQVRRYLDRLSRHNRTEDSDESYVTLAALVGALALARAVDDPSLSDEILARTARGLTRGPSQR